MSVVFSHILNSKEKYKNWQLDKEIKENKKLSYFDKCPIDSNKQNEHAQRVKAVLDAVEVMDEYSQTKAEDTEQLTNVARETIGQIAAMTGTALTGLYLLKNKKAQNALSEVFKGDLKNVLSLIPAGIFYLGPSMITSIFGSFWSAKKEIEASRIGRQEAITDVLSSANQFAVFNEEQTKTINKLSKEIKIDKSEVKKNTNPSRGLGFKEALNVLIKPNKEFLEIQNNNNKKYQEEYEQNCKANIDINERTQALEDQELIQTIIRKIDIASQDYAENAELATAGISLVATAISGGTFKLTQKLLTKLKVSQKNSKTVSAVLSFAMFMASIIFSTKIQKEASRVGRYVAKKELLQNTNSLLYLEEEKYKDENPTKKNSSQNIFSKTYTVIKDFIEYQKYKKENIKTNIAIRKAKEQIELTESQKQKAEQLQNNVFKMFNKLDEKSQSYSENIEATGDATISIAALLTVFLPILFTTKIDFNKKGALIKSLLASSIPLVSVFGLNFATTKLQREATRIACMEACEEYSDYKHFLGKNLNEKTENIATNLKTNENISPFLKKYLNGIN